MIEGFDSVLDDDKLKATMARTEIQITETENVAASVRNDPVKTRVRPVKGPNGCLDPRLDPFGVQMGSV